MLLKAQFGMNREDLVTQTARLFGFRTTGQQVADRADDAIDLEIESGRIAVEK